MDLFGAAEEAGTYESGRAKYMLPTMAEVRAMEATNGYTTAGTFVGLGGLDVGFRMAGFRMVYASEFIPAAADAYEANCSVKVDRRDIREVLPEEILEQAGCVPTVFPGSPPCFPAGAMVTTSSGPRPIEEIAVGDLVLTHEGRYRPVIATHKKLYKGPVTHATFKYGRGPLHATPEHPVLAKRRMQGKPKRYEPEAWIEIGSLAPGDLLCEPFTKQFLGFPQLNTEVVRGSRHGDNFIQVEPVVLDIQELPVAWMLGYYLAEGWRRNKGCVLNPLGTQKTRRGVYLACHPRESEEACSRARSAGLELRGGPIKTHTAYKHTAGNPGGRPSVGPALSYWYLCGLFGDGAGGKFLPEWVFGAPLEWRRELMAGYLFGDGGEGGTKIGAASVSKDLAWGMARLATEIYGVVASFGSGRDAGTAVIEGRVVNTRPAYGFNVARLGTPGTRTYNRPSLVDKRGGWVAVKAVDLRDTEEDVFNLGVQGDESYVVNGLAVHNCSSWSAAGSGSKTRERPCDACDGLGVTQGEWGAESGECVNCKGSGRLEGQSKAYSDAAQRTDDLFAHYTRLGVGVGSLALPIENVPGMIRGEDARAYVHRVTAEISSLGYSVAAGVLNAASFGAATSRERLIFICLRRDLGVPASLPSPSVEQPYTISEALEACVANGWEDHPEDVESCSMEGKAVGRSFWAIQEARRRGLDEPDARTLACENCGEVPDRHRVLAADGEAYHWLAKPPGVLWDPSWVRGGSISKGLCADGERAVFTKLYNVLVVPHLDRPCPTITATGAQAGAASVTHPTQCRKLTPREAAVISGFPSDFQLGGPNATREERYERVGRAVPPPLSRAIATHIAKLLKEAGV
jgi:site-specific DNA-cytosine methylase